MGELSSSFLGGLGGVDIWVIGGDSIRVASMSWMTTETVPVIGLLWVEEEGEVER